MMAVAFDASGDIYIDKSGKAVTDHVNVRRARLQVDTLKFAATKLWPPTGRASGSRWQRRDHSITLLYLEIIPHGRARAKSGEQNGDGPADLFLRILPSSHTTRVSNIKEPSQAEDRRPQTISSDWVGQSMFIAGKPGFGFAHPKARRSSSPSLPPSAPTPWQIPHRRQGR
jgi:hypothetical protein